jgi:hypothetical protein
VRIEYLNKYSQLHAKEEKLFDEGKTDSWGLSYEEIKINDEASLKDNKELAMKLMLPKVMEIVLVGDNKITGAVYDIWVLHK